MGYKTAEINAGCGSKVSWI